MSRSSAAVRFPDQTVRFCVYNGTCDLLIPLLHDTLEQAWEAWQAWRDNTGINLWQDPKGVIEPVEIYSDYGGGFTWSGSAARNTVVDPTDPWDIGVSRIDGTPRWYTEAIEAW